MASGPWPTIPLGPLTYKTLSGPPGFTIGYYEALAKTIHDRTDHKNVIAMGSYDPQMDMHMVRVWCFDCDRDNVYRYTGHSLGRAEELDWRQIAAHEQLYHFMREPCFRMGNMAEVAEWISEWCRVRGPVGVSIKELYERAEQDHYCPPAVIDRLVEDMELDKPFRDGMIHFVQLKEGRIAHQASRITLPAGHPWRDW